MGRKELSKNGGCRMESIEIIMWWKMKKANGTGFFVRGIMMQLKAGNGLFMDFLRRIDTRIKRVKRIETAILLVQKALKV